MKRHGGGGGRNEIRMKLIGLEACGGCWMMAVGDAERAHRSHLHFYALEHCPSNGQYNISEAVQ
jgi:hypothetical protein